jgi:hypothetical protein
MKSESIKIRIDLDLLEYVRQLATSESRSIAKQLAHMINTHKARAEKIKEIQQGIKRK